ncbi:MAG TPA: hypothetical protein VFO44_04080 [Steroidobacteraceae bacterium]|nr:hypothetical protein [Steroidobacteraceae bacterium]
MQILINSDERICCDAELISRIEGVVEGSLEPFAVSITRVEVSLSDLNSSQAGARDKCCVIEVRLSGLKPLAVGHEAATLSEAIHEAAGQLRRSLGDYIESASKKADRQELGVIGGPG